MELGDIDQEFNEFNRIKTEPKEDEMKVINSSAPKDDPVELLERYKPIEDVRLSKDFILAFIFATNAEWRRNYLNELPKVIMSIYSREKCGNTGFTKEDENILQYIVQSDERVLTDALWFISLYLVPELSQWLLNSDPRDQNAPRVHDKKRLQLFIDTELGTIANKFFRGSNISEFARECRLSYMMTCGVPN